MVHAARHIDGGRLDQRLPPYSLEGMSTTGHLPSLTIYEACIVCWQESLPGEQYPGRCVKDVSSVSDLSRDTPRMGVLN